MALCNITGTLYLPNGQPAVLQEISFYKEDAKIKAGYLGAVLPDVVTVLTTATGFINVSLLTGYYRMFVKTDKLSALGKVTVPDTLTANIADVLDTQILPEPNPVWLDQVLLHRDQAQQSALLAKEAAYEAQTSQNETQEIANRVANSITYSSREAALAANVPATTTNIRVLHDGEMLGYIRKPSSMSTNYVPLRTQDGAYWIPDGIDTLRHWGAVSGITMQPDGIGFTGINCRTELTNLLRYVETNQKEVAHINQGDFYIEKPQTGAVIPVYNTGTLILKGEGMYASNLYFADSRIAAGDFKPFLSQRTNTVLDFLHMKDFAVISDWGSNGFWDDTSHAITFSSGNKKVLIERLRFENICQMCLALNNSLDVTVRDCHFNKSQRDGVHVTNSSKITVTNNKFKFISDDSIVFSRYQENNIANSAVIDGNLLEDSQGIYGTGYDSVIITNNVIRRPHIRGIELLRSSNWGDDRGKIPRINYLITNNIVTDVFKRTPFGGSGVEYAYIAVGDSSYPTYAQALPLGKLNPLADGSYVWGSNGELINNPAPHLHKEGNFVGNVNIIVSDNICMRTLEPVQSYLDYGFGPRYVQDVGPYTGPIQESFFYETHYAIRGSMRNVKVSGNLSYGATLPFEVWGFMENMIPDWDGLVLENNQIKYFRGNRAFDINGYGKLIIKGLIVDGDTFQTSSGRTANGGWSSLADKVVFNITNASVQVSGGHYSNVSSMSTVVNGELVFDEPITVYGDLVLSTSSINNKGIMEIPADVPYIYCKINLDKTSSTFNKVISTTKLHGNSVPTSGHYLAGQVVISTSPSVVGSTITTGWYRVTTGNTHVLGTDWKPITNTLA